MATIKNAPALRYMPLVEIEQVYEFSATAATTVVEMLNIPSGFRVTEVRVDFDDLGTGVTLDIGDGVDPDALFDGLDVSTSAGNSTWVPAADSLGRLYLTQDTIDITVVGAAATGSVRLRVRGHNDFDSQS